ncbi:MAG: class I SAM-dependent methyltransferase [Candidatus Omnitrophica bacterium]|nr:class I SAM-dependent methyltransferase [Candidatus Omnitrophota bacterium]
MDRELMNLGLNACSRGMCEEDRVWSRYSHDKVDIGEELAKVIRTLNKGLSLSEPIRALSIGSSIEPQFRILETACRGGLYLLDIDKAALGVVKERIKRQCTSYVSAIHGDYNRILLNTSHARAFLKKYLGGEKVRLITLHHSLYYSKESDWMQIFNNLYNNILQQESAIHTVLMASETNNEYTTTWLYNHFAGKFFNCYNDQNLREFGRKLKRNSLFKKAQVLVDTHSVRFFVSDFSKFMSVVWMILLYPNVHKYALAQREEITEYVYNKFWLKKKPLIQMQDHLVIYNGIRFKGLI